MTEKNEIDEEEVARLSINSEIMNMYFSSPDDHSIETGFLVFNHIMDIYGVILSVLTRKMISATQGSLVGTMKKVNEMENSQLNIILPILQSVLMITDMAKANSELLKEGKTTDMREEMAKVLISILEMNGSQVEVFDDPSKLMQMFEEKLGLEPDLSVSGGLWPGSKKSTETEH